MSVTGKERREVPLPSQEGKKGVMQYALYVTNLEIRILALWTVCGVEELGKDMWRNG